MLLLGLGILLGLTTWLETAVGTIQGYGVHRSWSWGLTQADVCAAAGCLLILALPLLGMFMAFGAELSRSETLGSHAEDLITLPLFLLTAGAILATQYSFMVDVLGTLTWPSCLATG